MIEWVARSSLEQADEILGHGEARARIRRTRL
jgi:hypothetical protein